LSTNGYCSRNGLFFFKENEQLIFIDTLGTLIAKLTGDYFKGFNEHNHGLLTNVNRDSICLIDRNFKKIFCESYTDEFRTVKDGYLVNIFDKEKYFLDLNFSKNDYDDYINNQSINQNNTRKSIEYKINFCNDIIYVNGSQTNFDIKYKQLQLSNLAKVEIKYNKLENLELLYAFNQKNEVAVYNCEGVQLTPYSLYMPIYVTKNVFSLADVLFDSNKQIVLEKSTHKIFRLEYINNMKYIVLYNNGYSSVFDTSYKLLYYNLPYEIDKKISDYEFMKYESDSTNTITFKLGGKDVKKVTYDKKMFDTEHLYLTSHRYKKNELSHYIYGIRMDKGVRFYEFVVDTMFPNFNLLQTKEFDFLFPDSLLNKLIQKKDTLQKIYDIDVNNYNNIPNYPAFTKGFHYKTVIKGSIFCLEFEDRIYDCINLESPIIEKVKPEILDNEEELIYIDNRARYETCNKVGYKDKSGNMVIPQIYQDNSMPFKKGLAIVVKDNENINESLRGVIDTSGKFIIPLKYRWLFRNNEGTAFIAAEEYEGTKTLLDNKNTLIDSSSYMEFLGKYIVIEQDSFTKILDSNLVEIAMVDGFNYKEDSDEFLIKMDNLEYYLVDGVKEESNSYFKRTKQKKLFDSAIRLEKNRYLYKDYNYFYLLNSEGNVLTRHYSGSEEIDYNKKEITFLGGYGEGVMNFEGQLLIPSIYADVKFISKFNVYLCIKRDNSFDLIYK
jgi:hypothetical protein